MIKKLYTVEDDQDDDGSGKKKKKVLYQVDNEDDNNESREMDQSELDNRSELFIDQQNEEKANKQDMLADEISNRKVFSYNTGRWYFLRRMSSPICCLFPCCKPRNKRDDILFKDAKQKLYEEMDLLEIVKKLRVN